MESVAVDMTPDECAAVVELMGSFTVTKSQRKDVHGRSQAVGWTDFRQLKRVAATTMMDHMVHLQLRINAMITKYFPDFEWTTLMLNDTTRSDPHVDQGNVGMSVVIIVMPPTGVATAGRSGMQGDGTVSQGMLMYVDDEPEVVARPGQIAMFSGHRMHMSTDYVGKRYSIIAFHHKTFKHAPESAQQKLTSLGYRLPGTAPPPTGVATAGRPGDDEADKSDGGDDDYDGEDIWADEDAPAGTSSASASVMSMMDENVIARATLLIPMRDRNTMNEWGMLSDDNKMIQLPTPRDGEGM